MPKRLLKPQGNGDAVALAAPLGSAHAPARHFHPSLACRKAIVAHIWRIIFGCFAGIEMDGQSPGPHGPDDSPHARTIAARFDTNLVPDSGDWSVRHTFTLYRSPNYLQ